MLKDSAPEPNASGAHNRTGDLSRTPARSAAFFDVDNTLIRGASLYQVGKKMYSQRVFTFKDIARFLWKQLKFLAAGESIEDINSVRDSALNFIQGMDVNQLHCIAYEVFDERLASRIWPGTRALTHHHIANGRPVWLVTATPIEIADVISQNLGLNGAIATIAEVIDGKYTGKLIGDIMHGQEKAIAVKKLAEKNHIDLSSSWAYSDSYNDLPLLHSVGNPIAINPDRKLRLYAWKKGWQVYDFRSGRRAATLGLRAATALGIVYGLWRSLKSLKR